MGALYYLYIVQSNPDDDSRFPKIVTEIAFVACFRVFIAVLLFTTCSLNSLRFYFVILLWTEQRVILPNIKDFLRLFSLLRKSVSQSFSIEQNILVINFRAK